VTSTVRLSAVSAISRVIAVVLGTANLIVVARVLGPQGRGDYVVLLAFLTVLTVLADAGLSMSAQSLAGAPDNDPAQMHAVLLRAVGLASVVTIALGILAFALHFGPLAGFEPETLAIILLIVPFALYARFWSALMLGLRRVATSAAAQILFAAALLGFDAVFLVPLSGGVRGAIVAYLAASVAQVLIMLRLAPRANRTTRRRPIRPMLTFGARSYPLTIASLAWSALPPLLLAHFAGASSVGVLSVAQQLSERAQLPVLALQDTAFQRMSSATRLDATETIQRYTRATAALMVLLSVAAIATAPLLIQLLFGAQYEGAAIALQVLMIPVPLISVAVLLTPFLLAQFRDPTVVSFVAWGQIMILAVGVLLIGDGLTAVSMAAILAIALAAASAATLLVFVARIRGHPWTVLVPSVSDARTALVAIRYASAFRRGDEE
jgi:antigen flippase